MKHQPIQPIDAVISWVDGYDPIYQEKLKSFCEEKQLDYKNVIEPTRVHQLNEIHFCLHGLRRFAPWIRHIYLITNQQIPSTVSALQNTAFGQKIKIIDQNELLHEAGISTPIFNSLSVEWLIWRIHGLSDRFLYLNDDFFIIRDVVPEDFFQKNRLVLRGQWKTQASQKWTYQIKQSIYASLGLPTPDPKTNPHRSWQEESARLAGYNNQFYLLPHAPFPLSKSTFESCAISKNEFITRNTQYPFRHKEQVSSIPWVVHQSIKEKQIVFMNDNETIMVNGATHTLKKIESRLKQAESNHNVKFVCMQSIDQAPIATQQYMLNWLEEHLVADPDKDHLKGAYQ